MHAIIFLACSEYRIELHNFPACLLILSFIKPTSCEINYPSDSICTNYETVK